MLIQGARNVNAGQGATQNAREHILSQYRVHRMEIQGREPHRLRIQGRELHILQTEGAYKAKTSASNTGHFMERDLVRPDACRLFPQYVYVYVYVCALAYTKAY